jgi:uncharacterized protein
VIGRTLLTLLQKHTTRTRMLIVISPAKTLDYLTPISCSKVTQPQFLGEAKKLNQILREYSPQQLVKLMSVSQDLALLNAQRNQSWATPFTRQNARQAIFAFKGEVYLGLDSDSLSTADLIYAQQHLRILSGLYGMLRPLDLIQAYRLEMGISLLNAQGRNLYAFWGDKITAAINQTISTHKDKLLINLASAEYFSVVKPSKLQAEIITPVFKDFKNGEYKVVSFFAKKARGKFAAWLIRNRIVDKLELTQFAEDGYHFSTQLSTDGTLVFVRKAE